MAINYEYYKVFYYVAKYKKISLAAEKLYVSQPAVTQTIKKLEEQFGGNLLVRTKSGIELTEIGQRLYDITSQSVEILDNVEYKFNKYENLEEGIIKIKTGNSLGKIVLDKALKKFCKDYPGIKLEISTGAPNKSVEKLYTGEVDMVFVYLPFELEYNNMNIVEYGKKEFVFAMSKKYAIENKVKISKIEDLNKYLLIVPIQESAIGKMFSKKFKNKLDDFNYVITQESMKKDFIMKDLGIGFILRDEIKKELKSGEIIEINIPNSKIETSIGIVTLNDKYSSYATKKFLSYLK